MKRIVIALMTLLSLNSLVFANQAGFFLGLGGSYNDLRVNSKLSGTMDVTSGFPPLGFFSSSNASFSHSRNAAAPEVQVGYFSKLPYPNWSWGAKFLYQYLGEGTNQQNVTLNYINPFVLNTITGSVQTHINHELAALAFIGYDYNNSVFYFGVGPSLFGTNNRVCSISDTNSGLYIGQIGFNSQTAWTFGGMFQLGMKYDFAPTWFLDVNYSYAQTGRYHANNTDTFTASTGGLNSGVMTFNTSNRLTTQSVMITVNKIFEIRDAE